MRQTKSPAERKEELITTAGHLFLENGYDQTSVSDIVKAIGVAQGTFYYYFKSKTDILEAVSEQMVIDMETEIGELSESMDMPCHTRICTMLNRIFYFRRTREPLIQLLHHESNSALHNKLSQKAIVRLTQIFSNVVKQGISTNEISVTYPEETAELFASMIDYAWHVPVTSSVKRERIGISLGEIIRRSIGLNDNVEFTIEF